MGHIRTDRVERGDRRWRGVVALLAATLSLVACGDCEDEIEAARAFLDDPANLTCQTREDCVVVGTGCHTFARGLCSLAQLGQVAAASARWSELSAELRDCEDDCAVCAADLSPQCIDGLCGGPP